MLRTKPKILLFDLETRPNEGYVWGKYEQDVIAFTKHWSLLSFAYKWLDGKSVKAYGLNQFKGRGGVKKLLSELWKLLDEADIVIAHNGDQFDVKKANALFVKHGLKPPSPYKTIDTKKVAKKHFRFDSNKLDDLGDFLGIGRKIQTGGFELWQGCMRGNKKSWTLMLRYNKQDVVLLEKVYKKLKPFMTEHPNWNVYLDRPDGCPNCGSKEMTSRGYVVTRTGKRHRYQCQTCGAWAVGKTKPIKDILR